jgi:hypothetical protein
LIVVEWSCFVLAFSDGGLFLSVTIVRIIQAFVPKGDE